MGVPGGDDPQANGGRARNQAFQEARARARPSRARYGSATRSWRRPGSRARNGSVWSPEDGLALARPLP